MTADLAEACAALAALLPVAQALTAEPDADGLPAMRPPDCAESFPPWNTAAENAVMDAHEGLRRLEASLRLAVTGHTGRRRGGSDAGTMAAIRAVEALAHGLPVRHIYEYNKRGRRKPCRCPHCCSLRYLGRLAGPIEELPAVDEAEPGRKVPGAACPYCPASMLYIRPRDMTVTCLRRLCLDSDGQHPFGHMEFSRMNGDPVIRWADGRVTWPPPPA